jgi:rare lipoprotein A
MGDEKQETINELTVGIKKAKPTKGIVSYYGKDPKKEHLNKQTASGEDFDPNLDTIALPDRPKSRKDYGKMYRVTNLDNGKSVVVRHNDLGPNKRLKRAGDLSYGAFKKIADEKKGLINATIEPYEEEE